MMHGQSLKTRDRSHFSETSPFTELLPGAGADHCYDFIAPEIYEALFHDFSTVSSYALKCGDVFCKMFVRCRVQSIT